MAKIEHYFTKFEADKFYHIYNRCIDRKQMFKNEGNYYFFLKKYEYYLDPVVQTYAYCLLGNHFHLLIKIRNETNLQEFKHQLKLTNNLNLHDLVSRQFRKFFQSYAMAFNKQQDRVGTLFQTPFKRVYVESELYLKRLVCYIHTNPQHHGITTDFRNWKWISYHRILINTPNTIENSETISWFDGHTEFEKFHLNKTFHKSHTISEMED